MIISLPTEIILPRKTKKDKRVGLNLNVYRNLHHSVEGQCKRAFFELMEEGLTALQPFKGAVRLVYTFHPRNKGRCDVSNMCCIVDKYFSDCLVMTGLLPDDCYDFIPEVKYTVGPIVKGSAIEVDVFAI